MPKKSTTKNQFVTSQEFNKRIDEIEQKMATKDDFKIFATKDDNKRLAVAILDLKDKVNSIEQKMAKSEDIQRIITTLDYMRGQTEHHEHKAVLNTERINELEPKVENLENRVTSLELHSTAK